jgi:hypothetical protein
MAMNVQVVRYFGGVILAGGMAAGVGAQDKVTIPDAQVEANVLRALAGAPELSTQNVQTSTVYGTVTLTGNVHDEALRTKAENLAARAEGVKKVVDQLTLGDTPAASGDQQAQEAPAASAQPEPGQPNAPVLQSDGTYAPAPDGSGAPPPTDAQAGAPQQGNAAQGQQQAYGQPGPGQPGPPPAPRRPMYQGYAPAPGGAVPGGQQAGLDVTVPAGAMLRIRVNRGLDSNHIQPGTPFDGTVLTDVIAGGAVAIPRGATVQGTVIDAKKAGVFKGEGELGLQVTSLTLGGQQYAMNTEIWQRDGGSKTAGTVNRTVGLGALGAVVGAVAGGGTGAAIGAGVGGAAGLASSAGGPRGEIIVPPESVLTFKTAQPTAVKTVSEQEMSRLAYSAGPAQPPRQPVQRRYYSPYYGYYYGPAYYPR